MGLIFHTFGFLHVSQNSFSRVARLRATNLDVQQTRAFNTARRTKLQHKSTYRTYSNYYYYLFTPYFRVTTLQPVIHLKVQPIHLRTVCSFCSLAEPTCLTAGRSTPIQQQHSVIYYTITQKQPSSKESKKGQFSCICTQPHSTTKGPTALLTRPN